MLVVNDAPMSVLGEWEAQPLFPSRACSERLPSSEALKERVAREGFEVVIISGKRVHQSKRIPPYNTLFQTANQSFSRVDVRWVVGSSLAASPRVCEQLQLLLQMSIILIMLV